MRLIQATAVLVATLVPHLAVANGRPSIAVVGIEATRETAKMTERLSAALSKRVKKSGRYDLRRVQSLEEIKLVFGCLKLTNVCMTRAGRAMAVDKLIWGTVTKKGRSRYRLTFKLLDVPSERVERFVNETLTLGALARTDRAVTPLAKGLLRPGPGTIRLSVGEPGAVVMLDQKVMATTNATPLLLSQVTPGKHHLLVAKDGFVTWSNDVEVRPDQTLKVDVALRSAVTAGSTTPDGFAADTDQVSTDRTGWKAAFWTSAVTTVVLAGLSIGFGVARAGLTSDKEDAIRNVAEAHGVENLPAGLFDPGADACIAAELDERANAVSDVCGRADLFGGLNLGLGIAAGLTAVASGVFFYKAYIDRGAERERQHPQARSWQLRPAASLTTAGVDLSIRF